MGLFGFFKKKGEAPADLDARLAALVAQLDDPDPKIRAAACNELSKLGSAARAAGPKLQELIADEDGDVCLAASAALSEVEH